MTDQGQDFAIQCEGLAWVDRMTSGQATEVDAEELRLWGLQSSAHARALQDAVDMRRAFVRLGKSRAIAENLASKPLLHRRAVFGGGMAVAASIAGFVVVRPPLGLWPSLRDMTADYRTAKGERQDVALADGVSLQLNTLTSVSRRGVSAGHGLDLIRGEIAVTARLSAGRTVEIFASSGRVIAGQAQFDVRAEADGACVTCTAGDVRVETGRAAYRVAAGQQLLYDGAGAGAVAKADIMVASAWRSGQLVLRDKPVMEAVAEINRYRDGMIVVANTALRHRKINAVLQIAQVNEVVPLICRLTGAQATTVGDYVVLT